MLAPDRGIGEDELEDLLQLFTGRRGVLLAVSGGADSVALMTLAARWRGEGGSTPLSVATVDHGLRPEAASECDRVRAWADELNFDCRVLRVPPGALTRNLQESARDARYALLDACAANQGADAISTAHTLDDQAETVLMRLVRGSSVDGLAAMREVSRRGGALFHLRPLLKTPRQRLVSTLRSAGIGWIEDPSNEDARFERVRLRRLMPALAAAGLTPDRLALLATRAARAADALDAAAARLLEEVASPDGGAVRLEGTALFGTAREVRIRAIALAIAAISPSSAVRLERLERLEEAFSAAAAAGAPLRRTLAGAVVTLTAARRIVITAERQRSRGFRTIQKQGS
jgi:tRNA(Ile)-lysidine synthase